jgi:hypothetical protein
MMKLAIYYSTSIIMFCVFVSIVVSIILRNLWYLLVGLFLGIGLCTIFAGIIGVLNKSVIVGGFEEDGREIVGSKAVAWGIFFIIIGIISLILGLVFFFLYIL